MFTALEYVPNLSETITPNRVRTKINPITVSSPPRRLVRNVNMDATDVMLFPSRSAFLGGQLDDPLFVDLARTKLARDDAFAHDENPVGQTDHLGHFRADHQNGQPLGGQFAHDAIDFRLGTYVDPAGRLIHYDDLL